MARKSYSHASDSSNQRGLRVVLIGAILLGVVSVVLFFATVAEYGDGGGMPSAWFFLLCGLPFWALAAWAGFGLMKRSRGR